MQHKLQSEFYAAFDAAIRYAAERSDSTPDASPQVNMEPIGFAVPGTEINAQFPRGVAADYLDEIGRSTEAEKLRWHDGHLALDKKGAIRRGVYGYAPIEDATAKVERHLDQWSHWGHSHPYIEVDRGDHDEHFDESLPADHVHLAHAEGEHDDNAPAYGADAEHEQVHWEDLPDRIADLIDEHGELQYRHRWGPHARDDVYQVDGSDEAGDLEDLFDELGVPVKRGDRWWGMSRDPERDSHPLWPLMGLVNNTEMGTGDAEEAASHLRNLAHDLLDPQFSEEDLNDEYRIHLPVDPAVKPDETHGQRERVAAMATDLADRYDELAAGPDKREAEDGKRYRELLAELRKTRPVVADPTDTD